MIGDDVEAKVEVVYSNIGKQWIASLLSPEDVELAAVRGNTRAEALRALADEIEPDEGPLRGYGG